MGIQNISGKQGFAGAFDTAAPLLVNTMDMLKIGK